MAVELSNLNSESLHFASCKQSKHPLVSLIVLNTVFRDAFGFHQVDKALFDGVNYEFFSSHSSLEGHETYFGSDSHD